MSLELSSSVIGGGRSLKPDCLLVSIMLLAAAVANT
jgi:hypothetical protein